MMTLQIHDENGPDIDLEVEDEDDARKTLRREYRTDAGGITWLLIDEGGRVIDGTR